MRVMKSGAGWSKSRRRMLKRRDDDCSIMYTRYFCIWHQYTLEWIPLQYIHKLVPRQQGKAWYRWAQWVSASGLLQAQIIDSDQASMRLNCQIRVAVRILMTAKQKQGVLASGLIRGCLECTQASSTVNAYAFLQIRSPTPIECVWLHQSYLGICLEWHWPDNQDLLCEILCC